MDEQCQISSKSIHRQEVVLLTPIHKDRLKTTIGVRIEIGRRIMEVTDGVSNADDITSARKASGHADRYDKYLSDKFLKVARMVYIIPMKHFGRSLTEHPVGVTKQIVIGEK